MDQTKLGAAMGIVLIVGAELTYFALVIYLMVATLGSSHLHQVTVGGAVVGTTVALAGIFGTAFAALLGVSVSPSSVDRSKDGFWNKLKSVLTLDNVLGAGVILYMFAGALLGLTYLVREVESPGVVKGIAIAFGGYVIAYVGKAYADWQEPSTNRHEHFANVGEKG